MPRGVPWSNRIRIGTQRAACDNRIVQAASGELKHRLDLFPCYIKLLHHFFKGQTVFEVLEHGAHRHTRATKDPCTSHFAWNAFHG